uniref:CBS domain-containing protein n=1 Tax=Octopus bimaculoides TaxID=37653 RepID=A0A0L8GTH4_OCTBM
MEEEIEKTSRKEVIEKEKEDVSPYMNPCPYTVYPNTPVSQVFQLFRSMGLRHLPVVSHDGEVRTKS